MVSIIFMSALSLHFENQKGCYFEASCIELYHGVIEIKACYRGLSTRNTQNTYTAIVS
jgi:hypothetical protein